MNTGKKTCPVCHRPMTEYVDGPRCMNVKAPEHRNGTIQPGKGASGKRYPGRSRHSLAQKLRNELRRVTEGIQDRGAN